MDCSVPIENDQLLLTMSMPIIGRYCDLRSLGSLMRLNHTYHYVCDIANICPSVKKDECSTFVCAELAQHYYLCSRALAYCAKQGNSAMFVHLSTPYKEVIYEELSSVDSFDMKNLDKQSRVDVLSWYAKYHGTQEKAEKAFNDLVLDRFCDKDADTLKILFQGRNLYIPHIKNSSIFKGICRMGDIDLLFSYFKSYGYNDDQKSLKRIIKYGTFSLIKALLENGSLLLGDVGKCDRTVVHFAVLYDQCRRLRLLIEHGFHVDAYDSYGRTPLHYAAKKSNIDAVRLLLEKGSNVHLVDNKGKTAYDYVPLTHIKISHAMGFDVSNLKYRNTVIRKLLEECTRI